MSVLWLGAITVQTFVPLSVAWAMLDIVRHGSAAVLVTLGLQARWGWWPVALGLFSGVAIDIDHAIAAWSLDPTAMMSLGASPPSHSLFGAAVLGGVAWLLLNRTAGYVVAAATLTHVIDDGLNRPGVPLYFPLSLDAHVLVPWSVGVGAVGLLVFASVVLGRRVLTEPTTHTNSSLRR